MTIRIWREIGYETLMFGIILFHFGCWINKVLEWEIIYGACTLMGLCLMGWSINMLSHVLLLDEADKQWMHQHEQDIKTVYRALLFIA